MSDKLETVKNLKPRERRFLKLLFTTDHNETDCYIESAIRKTPITRESAGVLASRMKKRVMAEANWDEILDAYDLGDHRLAHEINARLEANATEFYQGDVVAEVEDNGTRMRATVLLAELRGKKREKLDVKHSGTVKQEVIVYIPDNGRGDQADGS